MHRKCHDRPAHGAGPRHFCWYKSAQKIKSAKMLLCRRGPLPCKSGKTRYAKVLPFGFARALPSLQQNLLSPCSLTGPPSFCLISAEALWLTGSYNVHGMRNDLFFNYADSIDRPPCNQLISVISGSDNGPKLFGWRVHLMYTAWKVQSHSWIGDDIEQDQHSQWFRV